MWDSNEFYSHLHIQMLEKKCPYSSANRSEFPENFVRIVYWDLIAEIFDLAPNGDFYRGNILSAYRLVKIQINEFMVRQSAGLFSFYAKNSVNVYVGLHEKSAHKNFTQNRMKSGPFMENFRVRVFAGHPILICSTAQQIT